MKNSLRTLGLALLVLSLLAQGGCRRRGGRGGPGASGSKETMTVDLGHGATMEFVLIQPGTFMMGSEKGNVAKPVHQVRISKAFYMGKYEVTQEQWKAVMGTDPSHVAGVKNPVDSVSWEDCYAFIRALNQKAGGGVSLPTEAQWEYACRAGTVTEFYFGDDMAELLDNAWIVNNAEGTTRAVGQKPANPWGLYDMYGNVSEWCEDWYGDYTAGPQEDPTGPTNGAERVVRGGNCESTLGDCRSAVRGSAPPSQPAGFVGFRCVKAAESSTP